MIRTFIVFTVIAITTFFNADGATYRTYRRQRQVSTDKIISEDTEARCGQIPVDPLIADDEKGKYLSAPWNAGIYRKNIDNNNYYLICGGTLISPNLVVSAAHCFWKEGLTERMLKDNIQYKISVGKYNRDISIKDNAFTQIVDVDFIYIKDNFFGSNRHYANDVAVIVLSKNVNTSFVVSPVCMDWNKKYTVKNGSNGKVVGWGKTEKSESNPILLEASLPYIDGNSCRNRYKNGFDMYVTRDKFCAGTKGQDALEGYDGAGLTFVQNKAHYLTGIVSVKDPDTNDSVAVFSDVSYSIQWIHNIYKNHTNPEIRDLRGYIVQWDEDISVKKNNWLVGFDGYRRWINDELTLNCLKNETKMKGPNVVSTENLDKYPDINNIWAVCGQESMEIGRQLEIGTYLKSKDGARLTLTQNGLVAMDANGKTHWTPSGKGNRFVLQDDHNLVLYDGNHAVWSSNTVNSGAMYLLIQNNGTFVLFGKDNKKLWASENDPNLYRGKIVHWNNDKNQQKHFWLVGTDGNRRWIPNSETYQCLKGIGLANSIPISREVLDQLPDLNNIWVVCGQETMEIGRQLEIGTYLKSKDGAQLTLTHNGLVAVDANGNAHWTPSGKGNRLILQDDHNLVLYNGNHAIWASNTVNSGAISLSIKNDGTFALFDKENKRLWTSENDPNSYRGKIIHRDNDENQQKNSWLVGLDGYRRWIPNLETYQCLKGIGLANSISISSHILDQIPDLNNVWVVCGQESMEIRKQLELGTYLKSNDGAQLTLTNNGLVAVDANGNAHWTPSGKGNRLILQDDHNLVLYDENYVIWASNTVDSGAISLSIQSDGTFVLNDKENRTLWASENDPNTYRGQIVQWDNDNNQQKKSWLVGEDGNRRRIPNLETYECLKKIGLENSTSLSSKILDQLLDLHNVWVVCGQESMELGRQLEIGTYLKSKDGALLTLTKNGLQAVDANGKARWTPSGKGNRLILQDDHNLVLYNGKHAVWASNTMNSGAISLSIQNDGTFALFNKDNKKLWVSEDDPSFYSGKIVHWDKDKNKQKNFWFVGTDGYRRWISNKETYECLKNIGLADSFSISSQILDKLPVLENVWVVCGQESMEIGRQLEIGTYIKSKNGARLTLTQNGLVAIDSIGNTRWTPPGKGNRLLLQDNHNLVLYDGNDAVWTSNTVNSGANSLSIQNDGTFALFDKDKQIVWTYSL